MQKESTGDRIPRLTVNKSAWRIGTIALTVVIMGLVAVLLAQAGLWDADSSSDHPDPLTTLALLLAILAFLVQIFVFVFQTRASNQDVVRSEELNASTKVALEKIEANSAATQKVLFSQFERLLDYVVGQTQVSPAASLSSDLDREEDEASDRDDGGEAVSVGEVQQLVEEAVARAGQRPSFLSDAGSPSNEDKAIRRYLLSYPSRDEAEKAISVLRKLSPIAIAALTRYAMIEIQQRNRGGDVGLVRASERPPSTAELVEHGLVKEVGDRMVLTEKGRSIARLVSVKQGSRPDWAEKVMQPLLMRPN
jgi:hypothetical protein